MQHILLLIASSFSKYVEVKVIIENLLDPSMNSLYLMLNDSLCAE